MNLCRRNLLKAGAAAAAGIMASAAANAGIPAAKVEKYDEEYDVVIIGSGFAGMACALKAGRAGKKVLMLEKMPVVGGNSAICGGNVACPVNPVQKAQGIKDSRELFIADCLKDGLGLNHVELLSKIVDRCNDTIKFVEDCGAEFVPNHMLFEGAIHLSAIPGKNFFLLSQSESANLAILFNSFQSSINRYSIAFPIKLPILFH